MGTDEKRRTVRVGPSHPIMPEGISTRSLSGFAASTMEARPMSAAPDWIMDPMREGTALMSEHPVQVSSPSIRETVLRNWTAAMEMVMVAGSIGREGVKNNEIRRMNRYIGWQASESAVD